MQGAAARVAARPRGSAVAVGAPALALFSITLLAGALRLYALTRVPANPFYDAAVRSMTLSWHNFFFAAFEPAGRIAVDKPPLDLWLQVASVKLLGFHALALKLPEALAGTASVPLLYDVVRRVFGRGAGLASALALAVLPVTVLTSRSDTMDTVMMVLVIVAAWLVVHAAQTGRARFLYLAAAALALAFNVKLFEALLPVPALALLYLLADPHPARRRVLHVLGAALVFVAVSLSWVAAVSATPGSARPYPLGSTDGTVWSSVFVFDGVDRLGLSSRHPGAGGVKAGASPTRLVADNGAHLGRLAGSELVPALAFGAVALALGGLAAGRRRRTGSDVRRAFAIALAVWLGLGVVAFSAVGQLQLRYLEALTPAIAAALGIGIAAAAAGAGRRAGARVALGTALAASAGYELWLARSVPGVRVVVAAAALAGLLTLAAYTLFARRRGGAAAVSGTVALACLVAALAVPAWASVRIGHDHTTDAAMGGRLSTREAIALDRYLTAHQGRSRYEVATLNPWQAAPLIVRSAQPVIVIRNVNFRPLISAAELKAKARAGEIHYVFLGARCGPHGQHRSRRACPPAAKWARSHGHSIRLLGRRVGLYRVPR